MTDRSGLLLDGDADGQSGGDFVRTFGHESLRRSIDLSNRIGQDVSGAIGPVTRVGAPVTFTYRVTNTGQSPLSGVAVRDDNGTPANPADDFNATFVGGDADADGLLDVTETWTFTASRIATPGQYTNTGTATGTPPAGPPVADSDVSNHFALCPEIVDLARRGVHHQPTRILLTYNGEVDPDLAEEIANYTLSSPGQDGRFGTADDRRIRLRSADYDPLTRTVTLSPQGPLNVHHRYRVTAQNACPGGPAFVGLLNRRFSLADPVSHVGRDLHSTPATVSTGMERRRDVTGVSQAQNI